MSKIAPSSKVTAAGAAAFVVTLVVWALEEFYGYVLPAEVAAAATGLASFVLGYVVTEHRAPEPTITFTPDAELARIREV